MWCRTSRLSMLCCSLALAVAALASAQTTGGRASNEPLVIQNVTVIDVSKGSSKSGQSIVIQQGVISAVDRASRIRIPAGATIIDGTGKFVIPGLADMHNHLATAGDLQHLLAFGITTVFSPGMTLDAFRAVKAATRDEGSAYPRFFSAGAVFTAEGGHDPSRGTASFRPKSSDEARENVRTLKAAGVDAIKIILDAASDRRSQLYPVVPREIQAAVIEEAHKNGLRIFAHAPEYKLANDFMRMGGDGLVHGVADAPVDEGFIELMRSKQAPYITTTTLYEAIADYAGFVRRQAAFDLLGLLTPPQVSQMTSPQMVEQVNARFGDLAAAGYQKALPTIRANAKRLFEAGVLVVAGTDTAVPGVLPGYASQMELVLLANAGLGNAGALRCATINAQKMVGRDQQLGSVEIGKLADMVMLNADPTADIQNIRGVHRVIKAGKIYEPASLLGKAPDR
jgi:imidazolonepropionase-like amidohydrolase